MREPCFCSRDGGARKEARGQHALRRGLRRGAGRTLHDTGKAGDVSRLPKTVRYELVHQGIGARTSSSPDMAPSHAHESHPGRLRSGIGRGFAVRRAGPRHLPIPAHGAGKARRMGRSPATRTGAGKGRFLQERVTADKDRQACGPFSARVKRKARGITAPGRVRVTQSHAYGRGDGYANVFLHARRRTVRTPGGGDGGNGFGEDDCA